VEIGNKRADQIKHRPELARAAIMMLSSAGQRGDSARCRELGIASYLMKPVKRSELLRAILTVLRSAAPTENREPSAKPEHSLSVGQRQLRILLAEDNAVNQRLAVKLLEKRGHNVVVAGTGKQALAAWERDEFNLILMDVQMPEMDGFEVTNAIRLREASSDPQVAVPAHIPIVAMTAHAMKGDRERCLAAGMDAYVSKPLQIQQLFAVIESVLPPVAETDKRTPDQARAQTPQRSRSSKTVFDRNLVMARVEGDGELLREIVGLFLGGNPAAAVQHHGIHHTQRSCRARARRARAEGFSGQLRHQNSIRARSQAGSDGARPGVGGCARSLPKARRRGRLFEKRPGWADERRRFADLLITIDLTATLQGWPEKLR
jgi:two-component system, sensor histidine kinase and response regulator